MRVNQGRAVQSSVLMRTRRHGGWSCHPRDPRDRRPLYHPTSCRSTSPHILPRLPRLVRPFRQSSAHARQIYRKFTNQRRAALTMMSKYWVLVGSPHLGSPPLPPLRRLSPSSASSAQFGLCGSWLANSPSAPTTIFATDNIGNGSINSLKGRQRVQCVHPDQRPKHLPMTRGLRTLPASMLPAHASSVRPAHSSSSTYRLCFALQTVESADEVLVGSDNIWRLAQEGSTWEIKGSIDHESERNVLCRGWLDQIRGSGGSR